jgi:hypothetical protein
MARPYIIAAAIGMIAAADLSLAASGTQVLVAEHHGVLGSGRSLECSFFTGKGFQRLNLSPPASTRDRGRCPLISRLPG